MSLHLTGIAEEIVVPIAEHRNVQAEGLEVLETVQLTSLTVVTRQIGRKGQDRRRYQA